MHFANPELESLQSVPDVPQRLAEEHFAFHPFDTPFRRAARLLSSIWREDRGLIPGSFVDSEKRRRKLGSLLSHSDGREGHAFLHPGIARMARREVYNREAGSAWDADRLRRNLLSSQALCLNLFGPMRLDADFATALLSELMPDTIGEYIDVLFEHSPRRGHPALTNDYTAIDAVIRARTPTGARLLIGVEVKYSEDCFEGSPRIDKRHSEIARASGAFIDPDDPALRQNPAQQLFRLQNLMQAMLDNDLADEAALLFVAPTLNASAQDAAASYQALLTPPERGKVSFMALTMERVFDAIDAAGQRQYRNALFQRYADFHQVAGEIDVYAAERASAEDMKLLAPPGKCEV